MPKTSFRDGESAQSWAKLFLKKRGALNLSRERLAREADLSPSLIAKIERGMHDPRDMSMGRLMALMRILRITPEELGLSSYTAMIGGGTIEIPTFQTLSAACAGEGASSGYLDPRVLPSTGKVENLLLAPFTQGINDPPVLVTENLPLSTGSWLIIERGGFTEDKLALCYLAETRQPMVFHWRYNLELTLLRPASGAGQVYWLGPDGALEIAGSFSRLRPLVVGPILSEIRHL
jgi:transcriptional regulator with XRE-family HTH domain